MLCGTEVEYTPVPKLETVGSREWLETEELLCTVDIILLY